MGRLYTVNRVGAFASFDPRIDGLSAPLHSSWSATDCPVRMRKIGAGNTDWSLAGPGEAMFAACSTAAEVNALYRGLARQPTLDFTPTNFLVPDSANNRMTDLIGTKHLTKQGAGAGATIERSPLGDGLWQAAQLGGNASYYAAANTNDYQITTNAFVFGFSMSVSRNAGGGVVLGKYADAALNGDGYAVTFNNGGGFGFLMNGTGGDLNEDTGSAIASQRVDDGRIRLYHMGRSVTSALGFVRTADVTPVIDDDLNPGDLTTDVATPFGLLTDNESSKLAQGDTQCQAICFWTGAAAENVIAYIGTIEDSLSTARELMSQSILQEPAVATPSRTIDGAAFRPNLLRPVLCTYAINFNSAGQTTGYVKLLCDTANPPTKEWGRVGGGSSTAATVVVDGVLTCLCPAGSYAKLVLVNVAGVPTLTITSQTEVSI